MHKTLTLKISFNKLSDGTSEGLIINKVHQALDREFGAHGFAGVQKLHGGESVAPEETAAFVAPAEPPVSDPANQPEAVEIDTPAKRKTRKSDGIA